MSIKSNGAENITINSAIKKFSKESTQANSEPSNGFINYLNTLNNNEEKEINSTNLRPYYPPESKVKFGSGGCFPIDIKETDAPTISHDINSDKKFDDFVELTARKSTVPTIPPILFSPLPAELNPHEQGPVAGPPVHEISDITLPPEHWPVFLPPVVGGIDGEVNPQNVFNIKLPPKLPPIVEPIEPGLVMGSTHEKMRDYSLPSLTISDKTVLADDVKEKSIRPEGWGVTIKGDPRGFIGWNVKDSTELLDKPQENDTNILKFNGPTLPPTPVEEPSQFHLPNNDGGFTVYMDKEGNVICGQLPDHAYDKPSIVPLPYEDENVLAYFAPKFKDSIMTTEPVNVSDDHLDSVAFMHGIEHAPPIQNTDDKLTPDLPVKDLDHIMPPTPVPDELAAFDGGPVGILIPYDGGFTVYMDQDGNAVCGIPPNPTQTAIDSFINEKTALHPIFSNNPTPATGEVNSFTEVNGAFELQNHSETT